MIRVLSLDAERSMFGLAQVSGAQQLSRRERSSGARSGAASRCGSTAVAAVLLKRGSKGGDPAAVALEGAAENQLLGHGV